MPDISEKAQPVSLQEFALAVQGLSLNWDDVKSIAVAVSGGADSMALAVLMHEFLRANYPDIPLHVLSFDHRLRSTSAQEVVHVEAVVSSWEECEFSALAWEYEGKITSRIQEKAREARYDYMCEYCTHNDIPYLFLGHHQQDQAETILFRLASGSGLKGLGGMSPVGYHGGVELARPLLDFPKERLIATCKDRGIDFVQDPSNENDAFARVRLRQSAKVLEEEGLSAKRLSVTAKRLRRAEDALEAISNKLFYIIQSGGDGGVEENKGCVIIGEAVLGDQPEEIILRLVIKAISYLNSEAENFPRMEKVEHLVNDIWAGGKFRKRTLGGVVFSMNKHGDLVMEREV